MPTSGEIVEVFSGIQGEGLRVGERHLFLRLARCNLDCPYCDQPEARSTPARAHVETAPGLRCFASPANPLAAEDVASALLRLNTPPIHRALALTGGEPLLQAPFLAALLPLVRESPLQVLLETNGVLHRALPPLLPFLDIVSMDLKLSSATGRPAPWKAHRLFLRAALKSAREVCMKAVVSDRTTPREVASVARWIAGFDRSLLLVLQPLTPPRRSPALPLRPPAPGQLLALQAVALEELDAVRVIPQTHRMIRQR